MQVIVQVAIEVPDGTEGFVGRIFMFDDPIWFKKTNVGVVGDHWWAWDGKEWKLFGHRKPNSLRVLPYGKTKAELPTGFEAWWEKYDDERRRCGYPPFDVAHEAWKAALNWASETKFWRKDHG